MCWRTKLCYGLQRMRAMKINGKVHCFFEQSGTFKNEFKKLGIPAFDYDLQNHFGETDHQIDLFAEIESAYEGKPSVFDTIRGGGKIMTLFWLSFRAFTLRVRNKCILRFAL